MKNKLVTIVFLSSLLTLIIVIFVGIEIGEFKILSVFQIFEDNKEISEKINNAVTLTTVNYQESVSGLEESYNSYLIKKEEYEQMFGFTKDKKNKSMFETKQYDIGYLWKELGKCATKHNLSIKIDVNSIESEQQNIYNLNFEVLGEYVNVSQFITELENDSDFSFRIYNFKMTGQANNVNANFLVKNVIIDPSTLNAGMNNNQ